MATVKNVFKSDENFPVYCKYDGQISAQPAYISLDLETGEVDAGYNPNPGGSSMSSRQFHGLEICIAIPCEASADQINAWIEDNEDHFQEILDSAEVAWRDSNKVGVLTEDARELIYRLDGQTFELDRFMIDRDYFADWLDDEKPGENQSLNDFAQNLLDRNGDGDCYFADDLRSVEAIKDLLLDMWADDLYARKDIEPHIAKMLLADGRCEDSAWMDELKEFAGA